MSTLERLSEDEARLLQLYRALTDHDRRLVFLYLDGALELAERDREARPSNVVQLLPR